VSLPALEISGVIKDYRALRPLRVQELEVAAGEHVAVVGLDQPAAEIFINLVTGATLPDEGEIRVLGRSTSSVSDSSAWLEFVDRFGIVSERAVLLDAMSVLQNLAMPYSIDIEPLGDDLRGQAAQLARDVGVPDADWERRVGELDGAARLRVRLGRALALDPVVVLLEHPSAGLARGEVASIGREIRSRLQGRGADARRQAPASLTLTADPDFAHAVATRVLSLDAASGRLIPRRRGWFA
jgi:ABC-type transporter Mla maintaining outer membrane lipid asymmetry ATPase subunit MlaF